MPLNIISPSEINQVSCAFTISFSVKYEDYNSANYTNLLKYDTLPIEVCELKQGDSYHFNVPVNDEVEGAIIAYCHLEGARLRIGRNTSSSESAH